MTPPSSTPPPLTRQQGLDVQVALLQQTVEDLHADLVAISSLRDQWLKANLEARVGTLEGRVGEIEKLLIDMRPAVRFMTWVAMGVGGLIITLLWTLLTGQAKVLYP